MKDRAGIVNLRLTSDPRVAIGSHVGWRLFVQNAADGEWDQTGPAFPTGVEAFANVTKTAQYAYEIIL